MYVPSLGVGTLPTPLSPASVPHPLEPEGGGGAHSPAGEGLGESQFRRLEKKPSTLHILCGPLDPTCLGDFGSCTLALTPQKTVEAKYQKIKFRVCLLTM